MLEIDKEKVDTINNLKMVVYCLGKKKRSRAIDFINKIDDKILFTEWQSTVLKQLLEDIVFHIEEEPGTPVETLEATANGLFVEYRAHVQLRFELEKGIRKSHRGSMMPDDLIESLTEFYYKLLIKDAESGDYGDYRVWVPWEIDHTFNCSVRKFKHNKTSAI